MGRDLKVSVIIPTLNESHIIERSILSVKAQSYGNLEIIVIDGGSNDGTAERATTLGARVILDRRGNVSRSRNMGIRAAEGDIILRHDADEVMQNDYIEKIVDSFSDPVVWGVRTVCKFKYSDTLLGRSLAVRRKILLKGQDSDLMYYPIAVRKELLVAIGGYDERLVAFEDKDIGRRLVQMMKLQGFRFAVASDAVFYHIETDHTIGTRLKRGLWYGRGIIPLIVKYKLRNRRLSDLKHAVSPVIIPFLLFLSLGLVWVNPILSLLAAAPLLIWSLAWIIRAFKQSNDLPSAFMIPPIAFVEKLGASIGMALWTVSKLKTSDSQRVEVTG